MMEETIRQIAIWALPILLAVVFHEVAHGWVAFRLGDPTAARLGRLTLNPFAHVDLFGTVLLPLLLIVANSPFLFGYAKPVPVNYLNLRNPKRDMVWVALAGPATNLLLALGSVIVLKLVLSMLTPGSAESYSWSVLTILSSVALMLEKSVLINILLAVFNAFPIPPLDGGRVLVGLLPEPHAAMVARVEPFGFLIIVLLLMTHVLDAVIGPPIRFLINLFFGLL